MGRNTTTDDKIAAVAELTVEMSVITLYEDEEYIVADEGGAWCSEHGELTNDDVAQAQCNHEATADTRTGTYGDLPTIDVTAIAGIVAQDKDVQNETLERVAENNPEKLAEIAGPLFA